MVKECKKSSVYFRRDELELMDAEHLFKLKLSTHEVQSQITDRHLLSAIRERQVAAVVA